ncbi:DUF5689 domain-containing protein [Arcticibacterium luteifluviistationis]|uniref:Endonuclease n=1 Tax=Arcticibacterium luteifluviistationis TaxID=1784714 RepID=A0A2Z4GBH2_9BACT|nr:DUF5689 domain-containing protein [Arcticibacterium luteifluviistationis]AWV98283.1 hypothetical protein DJ013_08915 [Arcticibacterium luteifluviistationis]
MKYLFSILFLFSSFLGKAQLFSESFAYPEGTPLSTLLWDVHSGGTTNPVLTSEGLVFGNAPMDGGVALSGGGQDIHQGFKAQNSGTVYASFLVNVAEASSDGEYFLHLGPEDLGTNFRGRVFVKKADNRIAFGVSKSSSSANYANKVFQFNKTYQIVLKYTFQNSSKTDDTVELFVLENQTNAEPKSLVSAKEGEFDSNNIGSIAFRQGSGSKAATLIVDELRIADNWKDAVSLKRELSVELTLPDNLYAYRSKCVSEPVFPVTLNAYWPETELSIWSPSVNIMEFSVDGLNWSDQVTFRSTDNAYYEPFYIKMLATEVADDEGELTISIDNYGAEVIDHITARYAIFGLREDCSMAVKDVKKIQQGDSLLVTGVITASANEFSGFNYIEDETNGIRIQGDYGFEIGDKVQFYGILSELNQELVLQANTLKNARVLAKQSKEPKVVTLANLEEHVGSLVKLENVTLNDPNFVFLPNVNESLSQGNRVSPARIWSTTKIDGHLKPQGEFDITGVVGQYRDQYQIYPRLESDIENLGEIPESGPNISKEYTFDVAAWNLEWFGSEGNGPRDEALQMANAVQAMTEIDADVFILEEITSLNAFDDLVSSLGNYDGVCSPAVSGSGDPEFAQRVCFVYKTNTVKMVELKPLLGGTPVIADYPESFDRFWASGRLPALFVCDVQIDGVSRRLHVIGVHARANRNNPDERELVYKMRMRDLEVLKDSLDLHFSLASIIMAGDYNDDVDETVVTGFTKSTYSGFVSDTDNYKVLSKELSDKKEKSYLGYDNVIDHVMVSDELFDSVIEGGTQLQLSFIDIDGYPDNTSDHLPLLSRFMLKSILTSNVYTELDSVLIYPNPTGGDIKIGIDEDVKENVHLELFNIKGEQLDGFDADVKTVQKKLSKVLRKQASGVYIIKLMVGDGFRTYKIVKN